MENDAADVKSAEEKPRKRYEKPSIQSSTIKDTFLACGKCSSGPLEQLACNLFPELS